MSPIVGPTVAPMVLYLDFAKPSANGSAPNVIDVSAVALYTTRMGGQDSWFEACPLPSIDDIRKNQIVLIVLGLQIGPMQNVLADLQRVRPLQAVWCQQALLKAKEAASRRPPWLFAPPCTYPVFQISPYQHFERLARVKTAWSKHKTVHSRLTSVASAARRAFSSLLIFIVSSRS